jgi:hypothetical protein
LYTILPIKPSLLQIDVLINYYLENAKLLKSTMEELGFACYGGIDGPYVFVHMKVCLYIYAAFSPPPPSTILELNPLLTTHPTPPIP